MQCGNAPQANDSLVLALVSRVMHMRATCYEGSTRASLLKRNSLMNHLVNILQRTMNERVALKKSIAKWFSQIKTFHRLTVRLSSHITRHLNKEGRNS
jgi:hypothetical protein